jgi:putative two-component system response regulator
VGHRARSGEIFAILARAGRFRDEETAEHVDRMSRTCALIGRELRFGAAACVNLRVASAMHDIGKIGVPDGVLLKQGALNREERALIERHPEIGHQILASPSDPVLQLAATIALTHHERVDGRGYPGRLRGDQIPLPGRIAAVADVFDALTHDRVYRPALSVDDALSALRDGRGAHFDARVLDAFQAVLPKVLEIRRRYPDGVARRRAMSAPGNPGELTTDGRA